MNIIKRFASLTSEDKANLCVVIVVFLKNSGLFYYFYLLLKVLNLTYKCSNFLDSHFYF